MIENKTNCMSNGKYRYYYYPMLYKGFIYNKRFNIIDTSTRKDLYSNINKSKGIRGYTNPKLGYNDVPNVFIDLHKYLNILSDACYSNMPFSRYLSIYWAYMYKILSINQDMSSNNTDSYLKNMHISVQYNTDKYTNKFILCNID